jgi:hypothetical protein
MSALDPLEPQTVDEAHWWAQPGWVKIVTVVVGIPSFLYLTLSTD